MLCECSGDEGPRWKKGEQSGIVIIQIWDDGDLDEGGNSGGGKKWGTWLLSQLSILTLGFGSGGQIKPLWSSALSRESAWTF